MLIFHILYSAEVPAKPKEKKDAPGKLLDDLFRKTKALPCIYWLPLTKEQVTEIVYYVLLLPEVSHTKGFMRDMTDKSILLWPLFI